MKYQELKVWQKAHQNALEAIDLYKNQHNSKFDLIFKQFISSITSIGANIAEGSGDYKGKEFVRFLNIALRSAFETDNWLNVIKDSKIVNCSEDGISVIKVRNEEVIKMLIKLIHSQNST